MIVATPGEQVQPGGSEARRFVYGGVSFDVLGGACRDPSPAHFQGDVPALASVVCDVHGAPVPLPDGENPTPLRMIRSEWNGESGVVHGKGIHAHMRSLGTNRFVASVEHCLSGLSSHPVEETLAHSVLERCGGFVLHAAAIVLDGAAVAFVGPSGAGKSTACLLSGHPIFTRDKMAVAPMADGDWWAWPLLGGTTPDGATMAAEPALPVRAVLRVVRSTDGATKITPTSVHEACFLVRESCFVGMPESVIDPLERVAAMCEVVPASRLATVMGSDPTPETVSYTHLRAHEDRSLSRMPSSA